MSYHDMKAWRAGIGLSPQNLESFLLDQCRCFAGSRQMGTALPLDRAFAALLGLMTQSEACAVFGALHRFVAALMDAGQPALTWYPPSCTHASPDETAVLAILSRLRGRMPCHDEDLADDGQASTPSVLAAAKILAGVLKDAGLLHEPVLAPAEIERAA